MIVNPQLDQHGYNTLNLRTKAFKHHNEWEASEKISDIYRKKYKKGKAILHVYPTLNMTEKDPILEGD